MIFPYFSKNPNIGKIVQVPSLTKTPCPSFSIRGGFDENLPRILKDGQGVFVKEGTWTILPIFGFLEKYGKINHREMFNIFNMGIGMVLAIDRSQADRAIEILASYGDKATIIGRVTGQ